MFDIGYSELLLIAVVALVVIGPKDLPRVMRTVGGWVGKGRAMTRHVRAGFDTMMREAELDEMQKQWAQQNADIMRATPVVEDWMAPAPANATVTAGAVAAGALAAPAALSVAEAPGASAAGADHAGADHEGTATAVPATKPRRARKPRAAARQPAGEA
jgi:sec-independent protein translocase protein TatB